MPNHVENIITLKGDEKRIREMLEAIKNDDFGLGTLDFNKIIPMPNSLNIEAGSRTDKGLKAYSDFIDVYVFGRNAEDALNAIQNIPKEIEDAFLKQRKDAMLFNILSFMSNQLLGKGNTAASIDELYLFLTNMTAIEYIRNAMKRVRKKDSSIILASQNIEDFLIPSIREFTKPLFSIPTHQFLFNAGQINPKEYMDALQIEPSEFELIKYPERGTCLYRCGNERYLLQVIAPDYKSALFGKAGGR